MDDTNATALHKMSVMIDEVDKGSSAFVAFVRDYWYVAVLLVCVCLVVCLISQCYRCYEVVKCLACSCCCCRRKNNRRYADDC